MNEASFIFFKFWFKPIAIKTCLCLFVNFQMCLALAKAVADLVGQPVGRRNVHGDTGLHMCDACCLTYDCNSRPCEQVVKGKQRIIIVSDIQW